MIPGFLLAACLLGQDLLKAKAPNAPAPLASPVPPVGHEWVHPSVFHAPAGWNGYAYWMAVTPYMNSSEAVENPCLYVSRDGIQWSPAPGVTNPLIPRPRAARRYNSDPHLAADADGRLLLFYRVAGGDGNDTLYLTGSRNGRAWSAPKKILDVPLADERQLSPAVLFDGTEWVMYYVDSSAYPFTVRSRRAPRPEGPWSGPRAVEGVAAPAGSMLWHLDAFRDGALTVLLLDVTDVYRTRSGGKLYFATSKDGAAFQRAESPVLAGSAGWDQSLYRSCCLPEARGARKSYVIWYSAWGPETGWQLGRTEVPQDAGSGGSSIQR